jgi:holo-[acyl-carrier protein] synthase
MILGVGIDLVETERIRASYERFGDRFLKRILHPNEISYCLSQSEPAHFLAARFAAKEAISKAFGTGIGSVLGWLDMEVGKKENGEPFVILHGGGLKLLADRGGRQVLVSLTHTKGHSAAVAILEG